MDNKLDIHLTNQARECAILVDKNEYYAGNEHFQILCEYNLITDEEYENNENIVEDLKSEVEIGTADVICNDEDGELYLVIHTKEMWDKFKNSFLEYHKYNPCIIVYTVYTNNSCEYFIPKDLLEK